MADLSTIAQIWDILKFILIYFWWAILLIWIAILKIKWKNWPIDVVIIEKRGHNLIKSNDRAGKYVDKFSGMTGYRLQKAKDTIPVINYDWALHNVAVPTTIIERFVNFIRGNIGTLFLFRYGSKQYKPLKVEVKGKMQIIYKEMKDENDQSVYIKIYQPFDPRDKLGVLDFKVVDWDNMNFMVQEQRASIERRKKKGEWLKQMIVPIALMAITAIVCIIMIKFGYDYAVNLANKNANTGGTPANQPAQPPNIPIISDIIPQPSPTPGQ